MGDFLSMASRPQGLLRTPGRVGLLAAAVVIAVAGCGTSAASPSPSAAVQGASATPPASAPTSLTNVTLVNTKYDAELLPITAAIHNGYYKQHGINLTIDTVQTSTIATSALVSGRAQFGLMQAAFVVAGDAAGANMKMIGEVLDQLDYHIITAKGITSLAQLAGKKMADPGPNNGNTATMEAVMDAAGIGAKKLTYVTVGVQAAILAAIEKNQAQVGLLVDPFVIEAKQAGLNDLGLVTKYLPNNTAAAVAATQSYLSKNPALVRSFLAATLEGTKWAAQNPAAAIKLLETANGMSASVATASYNDVKDIYSLSGTVNGPAIQTWIQDAVQFGVMSKPLPAASMYTNQYLPAQ